MRLGLGRMLLGRGERGSAGHVGDAELGVQGAGFLPAFEEVEEEVAQGALVEDHGLARGVSSEVVGAQQLRTEGGGGEQEMILEAVGIYHVGGKDLAYDGEGAQGAAHFVLAEVGADLVGVEVHRDAAGVGVFGHAAQQRAQVGQREVEHARVRGGLGFLDGERRGQQQLHRAGKADMGRIEGADDGIGDGCLLGGEHAADDHAVLQRDFVGIDAAADVGVLQRHGLGVDVGVEHRAALVAAGGDAAGGADGLAEYDLAGGVGVDVELALGEGGAPDGQVAVADLDAAAEDGALDLDIAREDDVAVELGDFLGQDGSAHQVVFEKDFRCVETQFLEF